MKSEEYINEFYKERGMYRRDMGDPRHIIVDTIEDSNVIWYLTACDIWVTSQYHLRSSKITCDKCIEA